MNITFCKKLWPRMNLQTGISTHFDPLLELLELMEVMIQLKTSWEDLTRRLAAYHGVKKRQRLFSNNLFRS